MQIEQKEHYPKSDIILVHILSAFLKIIHKPINTFFP